MTESNLEYDRFGPWIIEISEIDPPPPLFLPYLNRSEEPLISIKIPRKIERRIAHPGMSLYDYMVILYQEDLVILERVGDDVRPETFFYRDVQDLLLGTHLLRGGLRLRMVGKVYEIPFNTVSSALMGRLVNMIRERYTPGLSISAPDKIPEFVYGDLSYLFVRLLAKQMDLFPEAWLLASQGNISVGSYESGTFRKLLFGIISKILLESIHLSNGTELKILHRGRSFRYKGQTVHGTDTYYIPLRNIIGARWVVDRKNLAVLNLILETGAGEASFPFLHDNPWISSYDQFLTAVQELSQALDAPEGPLRLARELAPPGF